VIAGARRSARKRIVAWFCAVHAIEPGEAAKYTPQRPVEAREFERMRAHGIVREARKGFYWVDLEALRADADARRRKLVPVVIAVCVAVAVALTLLYDG
jgi:hypothetical protein